MASDAARPEDDARPREDSILRELRDHPHRGALGALALDVLGRQAEGRTQFVGREHVKKRAADLGVVRDEAATSLCNVLDLLERGAETDRERALVASLAVIGLTDAVARDEAASSALLQRAVRHAVWLETSTETAWLTALALETENRLAERVLSEMAQHVIDTSVGPLHRAPRDRARSVALVAALSSSTNPHARALATELAAHAGLDGVVASAVRALDGTGRTSSADLRGEPALEGRAAPARASGATAFFRWVTGWALLVGIGRGIAALLGREGSVSLSIQGRELRVREAGGLLGTSTAERTSVVPLTAILEASRERRHGQAALYAGAAALAVGVLTGGFLVFDGLRSGELVIATTGAALMALGVVADLGADWLARTRGQGIAVELVLPRGRVVRLIAPSSQRADAFLEALRGRIR